MRRILLSLVTLLVVFCSTFVFADTPKYIPIFAYHNFEPTKKGSMTISTAKFEAQLQWLKSNGYTVIPLQEAADYLQGKIASVPAKSVVITMDDGRITVYTHALAIVKKYNIPVTLFIYPYIISREPYAMTWEQLKELQQTGLFTIESHTETHPNFKQMKKHLSASAYEKFVQVELLKSKSTLDKKLGAQVNSLAWPFGIYNDYVEQAAAKDGYRMALTIGYRCASKADRAMAVPRYMLLETQDMSLFHRMAQCSMQPRTHRL